jgi:exodeoxyribonuclease III
MFTVVTANVNGVRAAARRGGLAWLRKRVNAGEIDVICLQEVRATTDQLTEVLTAEGLADLHVAHDSSLRLGHAGVAILSTVPLTNIKTGVGAKEFDGTGRWVQAQVATNSGPLTIASIYVHSGDAEKPVQEEKYRFLDAMTKQLNKWQKSGEMFLASGDLNVAHREADLKNWKGNLANAGFLPQERAYFDKWFDKLGIADLGRQQAGDVVGPYTWWSWRGQAFDNDAGWRIDYHLATTPIAELCQDVVVHRAVDYDSRWSDHAPVSATFNL